MESVHFILFSYLGVNRFVICDLNTPYEEVKKLVAQAFNLPEEYSTAIQFTDGKGYTFTKEIFEYFILLFPQPEQKFYVRFESSTIMVNRAPGKARIYTPIAIKKDKYKRSHDMRDKDIVHSAVPLKRQNCFLGVLPACNGAELFGEHNQPPKRMRLMITAKKMKKRIKPAQTRRALKFD